MMGGEDEIIWEMILEKSCYCMYTFTNLGR